MSSTTEDSEPTLIYKIVKHNIDETSSDNYNTVTITDNLGIEDGEEYILSLNVFPAPVNQPDEYPPVYNSIKYHHKAPTSDSDHERCNYNSVKSDFFNNLKGKKFNIYI
jgi:hypothetical protein